MLDLASSCHVSIERLFLYFRVWGEDYYAHTPFTYVTVALT